MYRDSSVCNCLESLVLLCNINSCYQIEPDELHWLGSTGSGPIKFIVCNFAYTIETLIILAVGVA